jgi:hypothetical protein
VWTTHGCYVGEGNRALDIAVAAREEACNALIRASEQLAKLCDDANKAYQETDLMAAESLNKQMLAAQDAPPPEAPRQ